MIDFVTFARLGVSGMVEGVLVEIYCFLFSLFTHSFVVDLCLFFCLAFFLCICVEEHKEEEMAHENNKKEECKR